MDPAISRVLPSRIAPPGNLGTTASFAKIAFYKAKKLRFMVKSREKSEKMLSK